MEEILNELAVIAVFAIGAQWVAWRLRFPSILLLLLSGFLLGPVLGVVNPDELLGESLFPIVSMSVGLILFEGGLTLKLKELPVSGYVIFRLVSIGALITWIVATLGARLLLGLSWALAVLLGAILIVTGPTVVGPLLRQIRPKGRTGAILKWEGILIDPVGAVLAVLVFQVIILGGVRSVPGFILIGVLRSLVVGVVFGLLGAGILVALLRRYLIPDFLHNGVTLMLVVSFFAIAGRLAPEGGLLTVTVMGVALANQPWVRIQHILEFKENLQVLIVGVLFILLAGRVSVGNLIQVGWVVVIYIVILIVVARPLCVLVSSWGSTLRRTERLFLAWVAPRGIVAASVASVFGFELSAHGIEGADLLAPIVFVVIVGTVIFYGLTAGPVARKLGLAEKDPQGALIIGAHPFARSLAAQIQKLGFHTILIDSNYRHVTESNFEGLEAIYGNALSEEIIEDVDLGGVGRVMAMTSNDEVNTLLALRFPELFGRSEVYQLLPSDRDGNPASSQMRGRLLFGQNATFDFLSSKTNSGATVRTTTLTQDFSYSDFLKQNGPNVLPLCLVTDSGRLQIYTLDHQPTPKAGHKLISLYLANGQHG